MKQARKQASARSRTKSQPARVKPRNLLAIDPLLNKGGAHQRTDKRASRARQKAAFRAQRQESE